MNRLAGRLLILIGIGHAVVGVALFHAPLAAIVRDGLVNAVVHDGGEPYFDRAAAFWFLLFSPVLVMVGQVANRAVERHDAPLLRLIGWNLLAIGVVGVILIPVSGFWTLIALVPLILASARQVPSAA